MSGGPVRGGRTKQSSKEGDAAFKMKDVRVLEDEVEGGTEGCGIIFPVGICWESSSRWWVVARVTQVPLIDGEVGFSVK